jgi:hypothetical protein
MRVCERSVRVIGRLATIAFIGTLCCFARYPRTTSRIVEMKSYRPRTRPSRASRQARASRAEDPRHSGTPVSQAKSGPTPTPPRRSIRRSSQQTTSRASRSRRKPTRRSPTSDAKRDQEKQDTPSRRSTRSRANMTPLGRIDERKRNSNASDADLTLARRRDGGGPEGFAEGKVVDPRPASPTWIGPTRIEGASRGNLHAPFEYGPRQRLLS